MMASARQLLEDVARQLAERDEHARGLPTASPPVAHRRLCIGISTYDDYDGVWFTIQSVRLAHPEVADEVSFIVIDNHPEGSAAVHLKALEERVPQFRYVPFRGYRSTAVRDLLFREADADIVLCLDGHVMLEPGAIRALLGFFDEHPDSYDLIQGPLLDDSLGFVIGTHLDPTWGAGMYGRWAVDPRGEDRMGDPFEIEMNGLGLFACRKDAWVGINPRFRGFGGEEGYVQEKFRRRGDRVLCLPALRWIHRFARPHGAPYRPQWADRVRNYRFGWTEVGWDVAEMEDHFRDHLGHGENTEQMIAATARQADNPISYFDAIFCLNLDDDTVRWQQMRDRFAVLDIDWRVERFPAIATPSNHHFGCAQSWRQMVATAEARGYDHVLIFEDDAIFLDDTRTVLRTAIDELAGIEWDLCFLGACVHAHEFPLLPGRTALQECGPVTCTHALAVHRRAFARMLADIPDSPPGGEDAIAEWLREWLAIDQYFSRRIGDGTFRAVITTPRVATQPALRNFADADLALANRYVI